jgi:HEAT repeat protein
MRSTAAQLRDRGRIPKNYEAKFVNKPFIELLTLLHSQSAAERSSATRLLGRVDNQECIDNLCFALKEEKKLYTKIEICNALAGLGEPALPNLICLLGQIGNNQHKKVPSKNFKKSSYPLPRDIVARILIRMGSKSLPYLIKVLDSEDSTKISEAIDAIGFISFYEKDGRCFQNLLRCYENNKSNDLITWKIARAMSAFPSSYEFLNQLYQSTTNPGIRLEIKRSLQLMDKKN